MSVVSSAAGWGTPCGAASTTRTPATTDMRRLPSAQISVLTANRSAPAPARASWRIDFSGGEARGPLLLEGRDAFSGVGLVEVDGLESDRQLKGWRRQPQHLVE